MAKPYLELTKLQRELVFDMIRNQGYAEGVHTLYQRLRRIFGNRPHPAMNRKGKIAYKEDGGVYELEPRKGVTNTYVFLSYHSGMCPHGGEDHFARNYSCKGHEEGG